MTDRRSKPESGAKPRYRKDDPETYTIFVGDDFIGRVHKLKRASYKAVDGAMEWSRSYRTLWRAGNSLAKRWEKNQ